MSSLFGSGEKGSIPILYRHIGRGHRAWKPSVGSGGRGEDITQRRGSHDIGHLDGRVVAKPHHHAYIGRGRYVEHVEGVGGVQAG